MYTVDVRNSINGWYFSAAEIREALSGARLLNPSVDLSNPCNLNCPYCYIEEKNSVRKLRKPHELSLLETTQVIDDLHKAGAKTINIVGAGEPTVDPHFEEIIQYIFDLNMTTVLFTNGIQFYRRPDLISFLYERDVSVVLKYNSSNPDVQDLVAGRLGYTEKRNKVLESMLDAAFAAHMPTRLGLDIMVFKGNAKELPDIHKMCRQNNIYPIAGDYIPTGRTEGGTFQGFEAMHGFTEKERKHTIELLQPVSESERASLLRQLRRIDDELGVHRSGSCAYLGGGVCTQILGVYIDIEGKIWPCVARHMKTDSGLSDGLLGDVRSGDLPSKVWIDHPYMKTIRKQFDGGCPYKPALKFVETK